MLKCKMCGGELEITKETSVCECEYCGSKQTIPTVDDEKIMKLYDRANRLRMANEFDKAAGVYESIIAENDTEAEAYWGLLLCKYGIEYVDDPATGDKIPTCHRVSFDSIMEDSEFEMVMDNADALSRTLYREQAKQIEGIRKGIIEVSEKEEPYDIFICYKETDENGDRTIDSVMAQNVYETLTDKGYRVFFSRITLEDKLGTEYEPYIFAAINSAKVMLVFGTSYDYYNAVWVKNEWSRYLKMMAKDKGKHMIPCYKDIDAYDMPKEFKHLQAQDMGKVGADQDLLRGIDKILHPKVSAPATEIKDSSNQLDIQKALASAMTSNMNSNVGALLERGFMTLEDGDFDKADGLFEDVLNQNPKCAEAYMGKLMAYYKLRGVNEFAENIYLSIFTKYEKKQINVEYDIEDLIKNQCTTLGKIRNNTMKSIRKVLKNSSIETNLDCLNKYDETCDYIEEYCNLHNCAGKKAKQCGTYYHRYLQYATEETHRRFNIEKLLQDIVEEAKKTEEKKFYKSSRDKIMKAVEAYNARINDIAERKSNQAEIQYQSEYLEWQKKCEESIRDWPKKRQQILIDWKSKCDEIKIKYEQDKKEVDENNQKVKQRYQQAIDQYECELTRIDSQISSLKSSLEGLGLFKGKQKATIKDNIMLLQDEKSHLQKPVLECYGKLMTEPRLILPEQPVIPENPIVPEQPIKNDMNQKVYGEDILIDELSKEGISIGKEIVKLGTYKGEPITWIILDKRVGKELVLSKYALDFIPYNEDGGDTTWEQCTLRKWLNNDFLNKALENEKNKICMTKVTADSNPEYDTNSGNATNDKIFLLSNKEADKYFLDDEDRICYPTEYADAKDIEHRMEHCIWCWLRTPGFDSDLCAAMSKSGYLSEYGFCVNDAMVGIRPALWINKESLTDELYNGELVAGKSVIKLGSYKDESITWIILEKKDEKVLLLSKYILEFMPYNEEDKDTTWEQCTLREWLNNDFLNEALGAEKNIICMTKVTADSNPQYGTNPGNDTYDKIFLLSAEEVVEYFSEDNEMECYLTRHAEKTYIELLEEVGRSWWLRSPGCYSDCVTNVTHDGAVDSLGMDSDENFAIRPALWINLET